MPLTNAEKQKRWRDKRNALAKQAEQDPYPAFPRRDALGAKIEPYLKALHAEGKKNMATMSPGTVMHNVALLEWELVRYGAVPASSRTQAMARRRAKLVMSDDDGNG